MKRICYFFLLLVGLCQFSACSLNNVKVDNHLETYFAQNDLNGCFALLDNTHEFFHIYNLKRYRDSTFAPGGNFEVLSSLLAVETGRLNDQNALITPDGDSARPISLAEAFKTDNHPAFVKVAEMIGKDTMQYWLDSLHYGKAHLISDQEPFWLNDSLKITPDEQMGFIAKLYFVSLPFQKRTQQIVRKFMIREENILYTLAYKSSWNLMPDGKYLGWLTGWIEENKHIYFFVINATPLSGQPREQSLEKTAKSILTHYGFFQGKK